MPLSSTKLKRMDLTTHQMHLWLEWKKQPNAVYYSISLQYKLVGNIDLEKLDAALNATIQCFEGLRTYFEEEAGAPQQLVLEQVNARFNIHECADEDSAHKERLKLIADSIDLTVAPVNRYFLIRYPIDHSLLIVRIPHIVSDDFSIALFLNRLSQFYSASTLNKVIKAEKGIGEYLEYTTASREKDTGDRLSAYWTHQLKDAFFRVNFGLSNPRPTSDRGKRFYFSFDSHLTEQVRQLVKKQGSTIFNLMASLYKILIFKYYSDPDVLLGYPVNIRPREGEFENLFGYFVNIMLLRFPLNSNMTLIEILQQISKQRKEENRNRDFPVVDFAMQLTKRDHPGLGLPFNVYLSETRFVTSFELLGLVTSSIDAIFNESVTDLGLFYSIEHDRLRLAFEYNTHIFEGVFIERLANNFTNLVENALREPNQAIAQLDLLNEREIATITNLISGEHVDYPLTKTLHQLFEEQVDRAGDRVALKFGKQTMTYVDLDLQANRLAHALCENGALPGNVIAFSLERSFLMVCAILAILKTGNAYLPLDLNSSAASRRQLMLEDSRPIFLLTHSKEISQFLDCPTKVILVDQLDLSAMSAARFMIAQDSNEIANVLYTSGSTGRPKGVCVPHQGLVNRMMWMQEEYDLKSSQTILHKTPITFDVAGWEIFWPLMVGACCVIAEQGVEKDPLALIHTIERDQIDVMHFVPTMLEVFLKQLDKSRCCSLQLVFSSGEALSAKLVEIFCEKSTAKLHNLYGPTEASIDVSYWDCQQPTYYPDRVPIGKPIANIQLYVLNPLLQFVPIGISGELYIGGVGLARGYLNQPALTDAQFISNPFSSDSRSRLYKTGDQVRYLPDGSIEYIGRMDHELKFHGIRIHPQEIEIVLTQHPQILEALVTKKIDESGEDRLAAYVILRDLTGTLDVDAFKMELLTLLEKYLPFSMIPSALMILESFPLSSNGKVDRTALPVPTEKSLIRNAIYVEPINEIEKQLVDIWATCLNIEKIGVSDHFLGLGGDSMKAIQVVFQCQQRGLQVDVQTLFQYPTIRELAQNLTELEKITWVPRQPFSLLPPEDLDVLKELENIEDAYPASRLQAEFVFYAKDRPDLYRVYTTTYKIKGVLDIHKLEKSMIHVIARHPILRASIDSTHFSHFTVLVYKTVDWRINLISMSPEEKNSNAYEKWLHEEKRKLFNWSNAPLLRLTVHQFTEKDYWVTLTEPWLDGWSVSLVASQLFETYSTLLMGEFLPPVSVPKASHRDFVALEQESLRSEAERNFWVTELSDPPGNVLPFVKDAVEMTQISQSREIDCYTELSALARLTNTGLKHVLLAVHLRIISLLSGKKNVITGLMENGRPEIEDGEGVVGLFLSPIPFRQRLAEDATWLDLIRAVYEQELHYLGHRRYPIGQMKKDIDQDNVFDTLFNFVNFRHYALPVTEQFRLVEVSGSDQTYVPLTAHFSINEKTKKLHFYLDVDPRVISEQKASLIMGYYTKALACLIENPRHRYGCLNLLSFAESIQVSSIFDEEAINYHPESLCLNVLFEAAVTRNPENIALVFGERTLTYRELENRANQIAHCLLRMGVSTGNIVAIHLPRSIDLTVGILAILKTGACYLPLDPDYPADRLNFMLTDSEASFLISSDKYLKNYPTFMGKKIDIDDHSLFSMEPDTRPDISMDASCVAEILYTSGSTGRPKGVMGTHRAALNRLVWMWKRYPFAEEEVCVQKTAISFVDSIWEIFGALCDGRKLIIIPNDILKDPDAFIQCLTKEKIRRLLLVPSLLKALLVDEHLLEKLPLLTWWFIGGEELSKSLAIAFLKQMSGAKLINLYGSTEVTADATYCEINEWDQNSDHAPIGRPISNVGLRILDEWLQPVPYGHEGEIYVGGIGLAKGYLHQPGMSAERFIRDPFSKNSDAKLYRIGDRGRLLRNGEVEYLGRADSQIKIRGYRIEPQEIIRVIRTEDQVADVVLSTQKDKKGAYQLIAYVVAVERETGDPLKTLLYQKLRKNLPEFMMPQQIIMMDRLPLLPNGKVDIRSLPLPVYELALEKDSYIAPETKKEVRLTEIWTTFLNQDRISIKDNLVHLGADSLIVMQALARISSAFGISLSFVDFRADPTIHGIVKNIERLLSDAAALEAIQQGCIIEISSKGAKPPLFLIHPAGGLSSMYAQLASTLEDQPIYAINSPQLFGINLEYNTIEALAAFYIRVIERVHKGPYRLGGYSFGGLVAYEMAIQLHQNKVVVDRVILMDSFPSQTLEKSSLEIESEFQETGIERKIQMLHSFGHPGAFKSATDSALIDSLRNAFFLHYAMFLTYRPRPYDGVVLLLRSAGRTDDFWTSSQQGKFFQLEVAGTHHQLFDATHIDATVSGVKQLLDLSERSSMAHSSAALGLFFGPRPTVEMDSIKESLNGGILILEFNEPRRHNPFNERRESVLISSLMRAQNNPEVKAVIITGGQGQSFSAGGDFKEVRHFTGGEEVDRWIDHILELYQAPLRVLKPVIGAIDGYAVGMGFQFAMMCDWRIGTRNTKLTMPELKNKLSCTLGSSILCALLGSAAAQKIIYDCNVVPPEEALRLSLLHQIVDSEKLLESAIARAEILMTYPIEAFGNTKRMLSVPLLAALTAAEAPTKAACRQAFGAGEPQEFMKTVLR